MKKYNPLPKKHERTVSFSSPRNSRRGCLCKNRNEYSVKCCDGLLIEQGIGNINAGPAPCKRYTLNRNLIGFNTIYTVTYVDCNGTQQTISSRWWTPAVFFPSGTIIRLVAREIIDDGGLPFVEFDENNINCDGYRISEIATFGNFRTFRYSYLDCNNEVIFNETQTLPAAAAASFQATAVIYGEVVNQPQGIQSIRNTNLTNT